MNIEQVHMKVKFKKSTFDNTLFSAGALAHQGVPGHTILLFLTIAITSTAKRCSQQRSIHHQIMTIVISREQSQCTTLTSLRQSSFRRTSSQVSFSASASALVRFPNPLYELSSDCQVSWRI